MGFTEPDRSPGLLVSSYLTVSPLPPTEVDGGLFSVALSLAFRPVGVTHHHTLWSPDFPPVELKTAQNVQSQNQPATARPAQIFKNGYTAARDWQAATGFPPESDFSNATFRTRHFLATYGWLFGFDVEINFSLTANHLMN